MKSALICSIAAGLILTVIACNRAQTTANAQTGGLCGDPRLAGEAIEPITSEKDPRCGATAPVFVSQVAGVRLSPAAVMNCDMATALTNWIDGSVRRQAVELLKDEVIELRVAASYVCRTRNNKKGARLSEHGRANAIDISAIAFQSGDVISIESGWRTEEQAPYVKSLAEDACGMFGTVLDPDSDAFHKDHLHLDAAKRRNPYCP